MEEPTQMLELIQKKKMLEQEIQTLFYGTVEVREKKEKKYLYVHYREDGIAQTRYVGEYSEELYNLILNNTVRVKQMKKEIKQIAKSLQEMNYVEEELTHKIQCNIDFAKRNLVDSIYKQAMLEGVVTTFADTQSIIEGGKVNNMTAEDIMKIVNLKHAWEFILNPNVVLSPSNFALLCEINRLVEEGFYYTAGKIRSVPVRIGGTTWKPDLPIESQIKEELTALFEKQESEIEKAIELLLYIMKKQIFIDGNKRTAVIFCNHFLIAKGKGILAIPSEQTDTFKSLLLAYYEGKEEKKIKKWLQKECYLAIGEEK